MQYVLVLVKVTSLILLSVSLFVVFYSGISLNYAIMMIIKP